MGVRVDGGLVLLAGHGLPDGRPLDGEAADGAQAARVDGQGEGDEGVQVVDVEEAGGVGEVGGLGVDGAAGAQEGERAVAQRAGEGGVGVWVEHAAVGVAVAGCCCSRSPASRGDRAAESVAVEGGGGVLAAHMADLALELDQVDGLVAKDVLVDDQADLCGQFAEEQRGALRVDGTSVRVHWFGWGQRWQVDRGSADLAFLDEITDCLLPSSSGRVVVPDGIGITNQPSVEVPHVYRTKKRCTFLPEKEERHCKGK